MLVGRVPTGSSAPNVGRLGLDLGAVPSGSEPRGWVEERFD